MIDRHKNMTFVFCTINDIAIRCLETDSFKQREVKTKPVFCSDKKITISCNFVFTDL